ncbi:rho-associated protein kinase 1 [Salvelinus sp. IW2-2015]|uniref:rho-associated protein kinase 1 n=1 Tax=Salvelinus sp. IW2-2015 TaxID=2691554 RepID=UPI0038D41816
MRRPLPLFLKSAKLQKKLHQLEEQLNNEMQTKDELEHKCRTSTSRLEKISKELDEETSSRKALESSLRQLEREKALLQHKTVESTARPKARPTGNAAWPWRTRYTFISNL